VMRYKNPLGILYTMYADPDLHVRKPISDKEADHDD